MRFTVAAVAVTLIVGAPALGAQVSGKVPAGTIQTPLKAPVEKVTGRGSPLATPVGPAPQNLRVLPGGPMVHTLAWNRLPGISGYNVFRNNAQTNGTWMMANATPLLAETYADSSIELPGAKYRVTALYADGRQGSTDLVYASPPQLQVPTGFAAAKVGTGQVRLSWQPVNFAKGYRLFGTGQPAGGTLVAGTQTTLSNLADGTYNWQLTADYGGAWQGAGLPVASITLKTIPTANYRVVANGFRVMHETYDDALSRDGRGDEVYAAFTMFHYDRKSSRLLDRDLRRTVVHGDVNQAPGRVQAGTASNAGGLRTGDLFPAVADPSQRYGAAPTSNSFPFLVWQGPLTEGQDAVIILPTMWEYDGNGAGFDAWFQAELTNTPRMWSDVAVQAALTAKTLGLVTPSGTMNTSNGPVITGESVLYAIVNPAMLLNSSSYDRPIGLQRSKLAAVLPRRAIVLTREMIESAFGGGVVASYAGQSPVSSVTIAIPLVDAPGPDLQGNYVLYIQVERIP